MALKAEVHIETVWRCGRTILNRSFCDAPFKLADITEDLRLKELSLMLMSSSPGVLNGDEYNVEILLAEESSLTLETQSYQRLFEMQKGAMQNINVEMKEGASFTYLPHPVVPHKGSCFKAVNQIYLADACRLQWGEVISCGRRLNNEVFQFTSYHSVTNIYKNGKLVVKENLFLLPGKMHLQGIGNMEGFTHQATFLYLDESAGTDYLVEKLFEELKSHPDICFGISALPVNGLVVRLLGYKAEQLFLLLKQLSFSIAKTQTALTLKKEAYV